MKVAGGDAFPMISFPNGEAEKPQKSSIKSHGSSTLLKFNSSPYRKVSKPQIGSRIVFQASFFRANVFVATPDLTTKRFLPLQKTLKQQLLQIGSNWPSQPQHLKFFNWCFNTIFRKAQIFPPFKNGNRFASGTGISFAPDPPRISRRSKKPSVET